MNQNHVSPTNPSSCAPGWLGFKTFCAAMLLPMLLLLLLPATAQAQFDYSTNNSAITITGYTGSGGAVTIPNRINGWPVSRIESYAFSWRTDLTSLTIPSSVTSIGDYAFAYCTSLANITISSNLTSIGNWTFFQCYDLTNMVIPGSVTSIGDAPFDLCNKLRAITVDPANGFYCDVDGVLFDKSLTMLIKYPEGRAGTCAVPNSVTSMGTRAFGYSANLASITVGAQNSMYSSVDGVLFDKYQTRLLQCPGGITGSYTIPNGVNNIASWAFYGCASLTSVTIPNSVLILESGAFGSCFNLTNVVIPNGVITLMDWVFESCYSLVSITIPSSVLSIGDSMFESSTRLKNVYFLGNAPALGGSSVFNNATNATVYYLSGTTGWGSTYAGRPTVLWNPNLPSIMSQPVSRISPAGSTVTFILSASGPMPLTYQWRKNGNNLLNGGSLSGVTTTNLTISNAQSADSGNYTVVVSNSYGSVTSSIAVLTIRTLGIPPPSIAGYVVQYDQTMSGNDRGAVTCDANYIHFSNGSPPEPYLYEVIDPYSFKVTSFDPDNPTIAWSHMLFVFTNRDSGFMYDLDEDSQFLGTFRMFQASSTPVIIRFGQNTNISEMTVHRTWFDDDPGNALPWPIAREAVSAGNIARIALSATPGQAGEALAEPGINIQFDLGGMAWDDVKDATVRVTLDFFYSLEAHWTQGTGSGNTWISSSPGGWEDSLGYETQETGQRGTRVTQSYDVRLKDLGSFLGLSIGCQAHSASNSAATNSSRVEADIHSIAIEFLDPRRPAITSQTLSHTNMAGTIDIFSVSATGNSPMTYQWKFNGANIVDGGTIFGANTPRLILSKLQPARAGNYSVVVSNAYSSATSQVVALSVLIGAPSTNAVYQSSLFAGPNGVAGYVNGSSNTARFNQPYGVAVDLSGNIYVADKHNSAIRKITPAGVVTNFAGLAGVSGIADGTGSAARFNQPMGLAVDGSGNVYVADTYNNTIRKITPAGAVTTFAGNPDVAGFVGGTGNAALFFGPIDVTVDRNNNVYVADILNFAIRKITPAGVVSTLAGSAYSPGSADGIGAEAQFNFPQGVAVDRNGYVYVADNSNRIIRKITPAGEVTTFAGSPGIEGSDDGIGNAALFDRPKGIAVDENGNVFVSDADDCTIRKITPDRVVTTFAGNQNIYPANSVDGIGTNAQFNLPQGLSMDASGNLYVADTGGHTIRKITSAGVVTTVAGSPLNYGSANGPRLLARFNQPYGVAVDGSSNVYVADTFNCTIRKITPAGLTTTFAGSPGVWGYANGIGSAAQFSNPVGVAVDATGNLYVTEEGNPTIRKITPAGEVTTLAGSPNGYGSSDGPGSVAQFNSPKGIAVDGNGFVYVADSDDNTIRKITPSGVVSTLAGSPGIEGCDDGPGSAARFTSPEDIAVDGSGYVYVADSENNTIRKITPSGVVSTLGGRPNVFPPNSVNGIGTAAQFADPQSIAVDASGNVYVGDYESGCLRKITPSGEVTTLTDVSGRALLFNNPTGLAIDRNGNLYVSNDQDNNIVLLTPAGSPLAPSMIAQTTGPNFGVRTNRFGFNVIGTPNTSVVVETRTNLAIGAWVSLETNAMTSGSFYFSDSKWTNYPGRFYRVRTAQ